MQYVIKRKNETTEQFLKRATELANIYGSVTAKFKGGYAVIKSTDTKPEQKPQIRSYICVKQYKKFRKGDVLRHLDDIWYNEKGQLTDQQIKELTEYFELNITIA